MDRDALKALLARVEDATGADMELDVDIWSVLGEHPNSPAFAGAFTGSLDAVMAWAKKMAPGWRVALSELPENHRCRWEASLTKSALDESYGRSNTPAIALLAALLNVLIAEPGHD